MQKRPTLNSDWLDHPMSRRRALELGAWSALSAASFALGDRSDAADPKTGAAKEEAMLPKVSPTVLPTIFLSHGAPTLVTDPGQAHDFIASLGASLPRPRAILCVSAHWTTSEPIYDASERPATIHDFYGFPEALYAIEYPAAGDRDLRASIQAALETAGVRVTSEERGLDHGAWVPLRLMYPKAEIPVVQLSLQPGLGTAHHHALGRALKNLRGDGVLVLGSGGATHNLRALAADGSEPPAWASDFERWLVDAAERGDADALIDYRKRAPAAERNHPTEEHYLPILVALGAAGDAPSGRVLHRSMNFGTLSMAAFAFS